METYLCLDCGSTDITECGTLCVECEGGDIQVSSADDVILNTITSDMYKGNWSDAQEAYKNLNMSATDFQYRTIHMDIQTLTNFTMLGFYIRKEV
jgi:hypothetical protein